MGSSQDYFLGEIPSKALERIGGRIKLDSGEKVLLYLNHGIFRFGVSGTIFTNKRVMNYNKKSVVSFPYFDIKKIRLSNMDQPLCEVWIESEDTVQLCSMTSKAQEEFIKILSPHVKVAMGQQEMDKESLEKRKSIVDGLKKKDPSGRISLILDVPVQIDSGGKVYAKKVLFGLMTGGMAAATENKFIMNAVVLPDICCLCGLFEGTKEMMIEYHFRQGSGWSSLTGVNLGAMMTMSYRVCELCAWEELKPILITNFQKSGNAWYLSLSVLNPETARWIGDANKSIDSIPSGKA